MNRAIFEGGAGRFAVLGHAQLTLDPAGAPIPGIPADSRLRRIVLRPKGAMTFTLDGTNPAGANAMFALENEIVVLDCDGDGIRLAGNGTDVRIIYFGT